ncbi:MAG: hypothetical protein BJ554DRAFT_2753 [Olpidium bornovanus]|uniref:Uncharacterized protein n=1 Tax=Olpidium bornovanus TaxID=278681 RepID=A0A8H7ZQK1_9FUNG|nr:MAG: hypothetical protein BJ554DRAFT_2753 [Olpidium bornovanus]
MFLPSDLGHDVEGNVGDSVAFCTTPEAARRAPGARQFPGGFVVSAHFRRSSEYVQVAGRIDQRYGRSHRVYGASARGTRGDNCCLFTHASKYEQGRENWGRTAVNGETGLSCSGYARFVNFVDPDAGLFCIRCCNGDNHKFCSSDQSELGCEHLVNGDYEPQGDRPNPPSQRLAQTIAKRSSTVRNGSLLTIRLAAALNNGMLLHRSTQARLLLPAVSRSRSRHATGELYFKVQAAVNPF